MKYVRYINIFTLLILPKALYNKLIIIERINEKVKFIIKNN